jgi:CheY-like chemotaxis protein
MPTSLHILVVDDHPQVADYLKQALESMGHRVDVAGNGIEAMNAVEHRRRAQDPHHLVIADITMPLLDGISMIKELRRVQDPVDVVLMTGNADLIARLGEDVQRHGCIAMLAKPIDPVHLGQLLDFVTLRLSRSVAAPPTAVQAPITAPAPGASTTEQRRQTALPAETGEYQPHTSGSASVSVGRALPPPGTEAPPGRRPGDPRFISGFHTPPPEAPAVPPPRSPSDVRYTARFEPQAPQIPNAAAPPPLPYPPQARQAPPLAQPPAGARPPVPPRDVRPPAVPVAPRPAAPDQRLAPPAAPPQDPRRASRLTQMPPAAPPVAPGLPPVPRAADGRGGTAPQALEPRRTVPLPPAAPPRARAIDADPPMRTPLPQAPVEGAGQSPFTRSIPGREPAAEVSQDPFAQSSRMRRTVVGTVTTPLPSAPAEARSDTRMVACAYCRGSFRAAVKPVPYNLVCVHCGQLNRIDP